MRHGAVLGERLYIVAFGMKGIVTREKTEAVLEKIIEIIGMDKAGMEGHSWSYPVPKSDGKNGGGTGNTAIQPFLMAHPFVESFIASDNYCEAFEWRGSTYVILCSCVAPSRFMPDVRKCLEDEFGTNVGVFYGCVVPP